MKHYNQLIDYINKNNKNFIFIVLFYSLWLVYKYAFTFNPELQSFSGRMISEATFQGYDISKRVKIFYLSGALFLLSITFFSIAAWRISTYLKGFFKTPELKIINYTSLAGIVFYLFTLWSPSINISLELIYCIHSMCLTGFILKWLLLKNKPQAELINTAFYIITFILGVSIFFILNEVSVLFNFFQKSDFLITLFISAESFLLVVAAYIKKKEPPEAKAWVDKISFLLIPIAFIPLLSFLKDEMYLILNEHQVYYFSPRKLYLFFLLCIFGNIVWRYKKFSNGKLHNVQSNERLVALRYFPLLVISITAYTFYTPFIEVSTEMYEAGNRFLPLMEFQKFGTVPILEKFNSHQLLELFWGGVYALFNGLHGREMMIYDFMNIVVGALLIYYFIYKLSHNAYVALFITLFFPFTDTLIHLSHSIAFIAIFMLHILVNQKATLKNYLLLFCCSAFLILWRMDIGYASLIAIAGTLFIYWLNEKRFVFHLKILIKSVFIFSLSCFLFLGVIAWWRGINVFHKLLNGLNYLASAQSYGYISLGDGSMAGFKMQYFVFPLVIIFGFCVLVVFFKRYNISKSQRFVYTSFIFLSIYYAVNFQRGIVAHTFGAGSDGWLSPTLFLILSGSIYLFLHKKSQTTKFILFIAFSTFLLLNYKYPAVANPQNTYSQTIDKIKNFSAIEPHENIVRSLGDINYEETHFGRFRKLITEQLSETQTFIDFSNAPMLYYLTKKITPSYFYQNPLTIHNDYLQNNFISELKNYDAPLIIFSNFPETSVDHPFGVPNSLRHYRLAEFFYTNYQPFSIIDGLCIWKRNDFIIENKTKNIFSFNSDTLKNSPEINGEINLKADKKYYFEMKYKNYNASSFIKVKDNISSRTLSSVFSNNKLHLNYFTLDSIEDGNLKFSINNSKNPVEYFTIIECDYIPDFYSIQPKQYELKQLPYIWGTYDENVHQEKVLADLTSQTLVITNKDIHYFNFSPDIDKSSGNTILMSLQCNNEIPVIMELMYGSKDGYKGSFSFTIPPGSDIREFAVRVSSQYNWYSNVDYIGLICKNTDGVTLNKIKLLKGS